MTRRFILTGAPGAGKTAVAQCLAVLGHDVVAEAATDLIADWQAWGSDAPWEEWGFIDAVAAVQREREAAPSQAGLRFSDRSVFCTLALTAFLERPAHPELMAEAEALAKAGWFERRVFFLEQLDFIVNTEARRISLADARRFGEVHNAIYRQFGFELVPVVAAPVEVRAAAILVEAQRG